VLPYCSDDQLLAELVVVVSTGWALPSRPERSGDVRHLLLLADPGEALSYREGAQRFLTLLDLAMRQDGLEEPIVSDDDALGLRILFGVHPNYRTELSPVVRREQASEYLVPSWHARPPRDRAGTFQRRHQGRAVRLALQCLRAAYGQEPRPSMRDADLIEERRWYYIAANHQVTRMRSQSIIRARVDGLHGYSFTESCNNEPGLKHSEFQVIEHPIGPTLTLDNIEELQTQPGRRDITVRFPRPYQAGELVGVAWEEELNFGEDATPWRRMFVSASSASDGFELEMTATFAPDVELPELVWRYRKVPEVDVFEIGPRDECEVLHYTDRTVSHQWAVDETERRIDYGLQWVWGPREQNWPPYRSTVV
jgi:hypothetical protein